MVLNTNHYNGFTHAMYGCKFLVLVDLLGLRLRVCAGVMMNNIVTTRGQGKLENGGACIRIIAVYIHASYKIYILYL